MNPKNFPPLTLKVHFSKFNHVLYFQIHSNITFKILDCTLCFDGHVRPVDLNVFKGKTQYTQETKLKNILLAIDSYE